MDFRKEPHEALRELLRGMANVCFLRAAVAASPSNFMSKSVRRSLNGYQWEDEDEDEWNLTIDIDYLENYTDFFAPREDKKKLTKSYYYTNGIYSPAFHTVAVGKASYLMYNEVRNLFSNLDELDIRTVSPVNVFVVTHERIDEIYSLTKKCIEEKAPFSSVYERAFKEMFRQSSHPFPDESSVRAGEELIKRFKSASKDEVILLLLSGGASSLVCVPADGITLQDKVATTELLFKAGADIKELNCVRKHLSKIKGGQLAQMTEATIHTITISDVFDDDPSSIGGGLAYPDHTTFKEAYNIMQRYKLWDQLPASVQQRLQDGCDKKIPDTPSDPEQFRHVTGYIAASNKTSVKAAYEAANDFLVSDLEKRLVIGDATDAAQDLVEKAKKGKNLFIDIRGGETTVEITGDGKGGRNQHMALAFALQAEKEKLHERYPKWAFLSGGTDGRDGPTDAAGGMVDDESLKRMRKAGIDPQKELDNCNSNHALAASGDLIPRDDTGTNVGDIQIFIGDPHG